MFYEDDPARLGLEVVYLNSVGGDRHSRAKPLISVCIPHKVGSHAWGQFSNLPEVRVDPSVLDLTWKVKAELSLRVVVVRHPLERLLSVYRMIFEDWCDEKRFLAKQWNNVCVTEVSETSSGKGFIEVEDSDTKKFSAVKFLYSMADEQRHGNDRYIHKIWQRFNPGRKLVDPKAQLKFSFSQFVRFVVNGSKEFDEDVINHKGLSYHWAPYWQECSLCSNLTSPHFVVRMERLERDLNQLFVRAGYGEEVARELAAKFPHTHSQQGGHSHGLTARYFSQLSKSQVADLYEMYRLDHVLFGYKPDEYLALAGSSLP